MAFFALADNFRGFKSEPKAQNTPLALSVEVKASKFRYRPLVRADGFQRECEQHVWSQSERRSCRRRVKFERPAPKGASLLIFLGFFSPRRVANQA